MAGEIKFQLDKIKKGLDPAQMAKLAYPVFIDNTPERTGNAKSRTSLRSNHINANYPYAQRLDDGWSRQKPNGMTKPTAKWFANYIKSLGSN
jgi:hypothetical protein